ncbi:MAG: C4-type zinc ribbon domain-containing protein [Candidatus Nanopelagicales bacterium]|jgi:hypothetical protein|nr:C4-type zinc ribbon domain-containing protein [Candidatus Nanopelagicales bacterium]
MKADPTVQEDLLELPVIDQKLAQLAKEARTSPLKEQTTEARARLVTAEEALVETRTQVKDLEREIARAEADVETVRARVTRDQQTMDSGTATPKQLTDIQHELESLARRQAELEDVELAIMERLEVTSAGLREADEQLQQARAQADELAAQWDRRADEIAAETAALDERRAAVVAGLPGELVKLYDRVSERTGQGAALLRFGRCGACQLVLSSSDLDRVRAAEPDDVVRCEECGAIMVRTAESGL